MTSAQHSSDSGVFGPRAFFRTAFPSPAVLVIDDIKRHDAATYRCRVDFRKGQTRSFRYNLTVIGEYIREVKNRNIALPRAHISRLPATFFSSSLCLSANDHRSLSARATQTNQCQAKLKNGNIANWRLFVAILKASSRGRARVMLSRAREKFESEEKENEREKDAERRIMIRFEKSIKLGTHAARRHEGERFDLIERTTRHGTEGSYFVRARSQSLSLSLSEPPFHTPKYANAHPFTGSIVAIPTTSPLRFPVARAPGRKVQPSSPPSPPGEGREKGP